MEEYKTLLCGLGYGEKKVMDVFQRPLEGNPQAKELCRHLSDNGADEILFYDASKDDASHEEGIGVLKELARAVDIPILAGGRVKRLEDVKKYLYAGAKAVFLDAAKEDNIDLIKEAADRFGSEKIAVWIATETEALRSEEFAQLGASLLLVEEGLSLPKENVLPWLSVRKTQQKEELCAVLASEGCCGVVLTQLKELMSEGGCNAYKQLCKEKGIAVDTFESSVPWEAFKTNSDGLLPVVVQDYKTLEVLMLAYMNQEAFEATLKSGRMTYFSRSRNTLWLKGETSGHFQYVKSLHLDCDNDTILAKVSQVGAACHTGAHSCFFQTLAKKEMKESNPLKVFEEVYGIIADRREHPKEGSYTNYLFDKGIDKILKKIGEEATEIVIAAKNPNPEETKYEISDFLYHAMVLMVLKGLTWEDITEELANR
ncbi:MAG: bifunctional phosphoribosyl-AMP cyclohydrolase/phosphoribosyl-ATP diphosphatase HisIE [bacterium]|nr:bifunctional phosphoribosyl-AMP cyclohydrolase/phosphoribosyl-ATP diphosphatase HisIE [bacterium]